MRGLFRRVPLAGWICALVAVINAVSWSIVVPPFQGPDEQAHFAYVQILAEDHRLPSSGDEERYSPEETTTLEDLRSYDTFMNSASPGISSRAQQEKLQHDLSTPLSRENIGDAGVASSQPPLFYLLAALPYGLGSSGTLLDRLELMRLLSALLAGITVLFVFLFIRETLPAVPWAWTVGGLSAALAPLLAFASSAVDPDSLLFAISAALFYCLARGFRRGLTPRLAGAIGGFIALGFLTKLNFVGLAPGALLGLAILLGREARASRPVYRSLGLGVGLAVSPLVLYVVVNAAAHHPVFGLVSAFVTALHGSVLGGASYTWQLYLPRLPGMTNDFPGLLPPFQIWFKGLVGEYNWLETVFPDWVYRIALLPAALIAGLVARELYTEASSLRRHSTEIAVYATMTVGVMAVTGVASYFTFPETEAQFSEPRYMLPVLAVGCVLLALAARGAGRRWGPSVGALIVLLVLAHDLFSQLLVISRFYG